MIDINNLIKHMTNEQFEDFRLMFHKEMRATELAIEEECDKRGVATINWRPEDNANNN